MRSNSKAYKQFFFSIFGTIAEYYDYALYGFTAAILSQHFFPDEDPGLSLLKTYGVFAAGSLAKPFGALLFGYLGDRYGRRFVLRVSMLGVIIPTVAIGFLPSYIEWGLVAPLLLILCRVLQGIFVAGESDGVRIFVYESFLRHYPTVANSLVGLACYTGIFLAAQAVALQQTYTSPESWRYLYFMGGLLGLIVLASRRLLGESVDYLVARKKATHLPPFDLKAYRWPLLATIFMCGAVGGSYHIFFVFMTTFISKLWPIMPFVAAQTLINQCLGVYMISILLAAFLSDSLGPKRSLLLGLISVIVSLSYLYQCFVMGEIPYGIWFLVAVSLALVHAPVYTLLLPEFPVLLRYRYLSLGHALGSMFFSGTAPLYATYLWHETHMATAPIYLLLFLQGLTLLALLIIQRRQHFRSLLMTRREPADGRDFL